MKRYRNRFVCWLKGHDLFPTDKHTSFHNRVYHCRRCDIETVANWDDEKNIFERNEDTITAIKVVFGFLLILTLVVGCTAGITKTDCVRTGEYMGYETQWDFWSGCYLNIEGDWVRSSMVNYIVYEEGK